ncbi:helix-turn-helix domain-containing protein, partial [Klebsiella oxytoca]
MARPKVYLINLTDDERSMLNKVIKNKTTCKTVLKRCQILRDLDETKGSRLTHAQIAHIYAVCPATVS